MMKMNKINIQKLLAAVIVTAVLFTVNYLFKHPINNETRVLYLDDLNFYNEVCKNTSFFEAIVHKGANKFRPAAYAVLFAAHQMADTNFERLDSLIFIWNLCIAVGVAGIAFRLIGQKTKLVLRTSLSAFAGVLYSISRFSYYVWTEVFGLMESMALILALCILMLLINYIMEESEHALYIAEILYGMVIFTHERYVLLAGVFVTAVFIKHGLKKMIKFVMPILTAAMFFVIRIAMFGNRFVDGTGGTSIIDTFNSKSMAGSMKSQVQYILGINAGPAYLNGIGFESVSPVINYCIMLQNILILACFYVFIVLVLKKRDFEQIKKSLIYLAFAACCIVSSSITIRVEMRWVYVTYAAFVIYLVYMVSYVAAQWKAKGWLLIGFIYLGIGFIYENYYQSYYPNLYYWGTRSMTGSLYEETLGSYGEDVFDKDFYIVGNSMGWTQDSWDVFFSQFFKEDRSFPYVTFVDNMDELLEIIPEKENSAIVLQENTAECRYINLTDSVQRSKVKMES